MKTRPGQFTQVGDGLSIDSDRGNAERQEELTTGTCKSGTVQFVEVAGAATPPEKGFAALPSR